MHLFWDQMMKGQIYCPSAKVAATLAGSARIVFCILLLTAHRILNEGRKVLDQGRSIDLDTRYK